MTALARRFLAARKLRTALSLAAVALGTGLLAALLTLSATMDRALDEQIARNFGTYDLMAGYHQVARYLSPEDEAQVRQIPTVTEVAGVLMPVTEPGLIYYGIPDSPLGRQFVTPKEGAYPGPGEALLSEAWARMRSLQVGDLAELPLGSGGRTVQVRISGLLPSLKVNGTQVIFERQWLAAQAGEPGATFLLIELAEGTAKSQVVNQLTEQFPEMTVYDRSFLKEVRQNLDALHPVALGLGIASLLAAAFLLTGAFQISLGERLRELAMLRAIAATPAQIRRMILAEGLFIGLSGSLLGSLAGGLGAALAAGGVAALLGVEPGPPAFPWTQLALVALGGTLTTLASAWGVARTASRLEPLQAMRPDLPIQEDGARRDGRFGLFLIALGLAAVASVPVYPAFRPGQSDGLQALAGSTGALAIALGLLLAAQRLLPLLLPIVALPFRRSTEAPVALRSILRHRHRSGLTIRAMGLGLVLVVAISTLMGTIARNMYEDIRRRHPADMQVAMPGIIHQGLNPQILDELRQLDSVAQVAATYDNTFALLTNYDFTRADPEWLAAMTKPDRSGSIPAYERIGVSTGDIQALVDLKAYSLVEGRVDQLGPADLVVEKRLAALLGFRLGDAITLNLQQDWERVQTEPRLQSFRVAAIVEGYHFALPDLLITTPIPGARPAGVRMLFASAAPAQLESAREAVRALISQPPYSMAEYSDAESALAEAQAQLSQRYALVGAVALVMAAVAAMSLINAMLNAINERKREFALLRSVGATPRQVRHMVMLEGAFLGLVGGLTGSLGGIILALGTLFGLEPEHFNRVSLPWPVIAGGLLLCLLLSLLAALGPARQVMRISPADAMRVE